MKVSPPSRDSELLLQFGLVGANWLMPAFRDSSSIQMLGNESADEN